MKSFEEWLLSEKKFEPPKKLTPVEKAKRQSKKNRGVANLAKNISSLESRISKDLSSSDETVKLTAAAVKTMLDTSERVGNKSSEKAGHHGVTGLKRKHIQKNGNGAKLKYVGKSGMHQEKEIKDKRVIQAMQAGSDNKLFKTQDGKEITNKMVNDYLKDFSITSKDIRGYNANKFMYERLSKIKLADEKDRKSKFLEVLDEVAKKVGHTPSMLRNSYLHQSLEEDFIKRGKVRQPGK